MHRKKFCNWRFDHSVNVRSLPFTSLKILPFAIPFFLALANFQSNRLENSSPYKPYLNFSRQNKCYSNRPSFAKQIDYCGVVQLTHERRYTQFESLKPISMETSSHYRSIVPSNRAPLYSFTSLILISNQLNKYWR